MRHRAVATILLSLSLLEGLTLGPSIAEAADGRARVEVTAGRVSVTAVDRPWAELLAELDRATGAVHRVRPRPAGSVTVMFTGLALEQALRQIFGGDSSFVLGYEAGAGSASGRLTDVWVVRGHRVPSDLSPVAIAPTLAAASPAAAVAAPAGPGDDRLSISARAARELADASPALLASLRDVDPSVRGTAAAMLGGVRADWAASALERLATGDPDPGVRAAAAAALAGSDSVVAGSVVRTALNDPVVAVRLRTVEALARRGDDVAYALLREALRDGDAQVRSAAAAGIPLHAAER
jgi:HEAT repeats